MSKIREDEIHDSAVDRTSAEQVYDVCVERVRQDMKWGTQNHSPGRWMLILMEEVGEFSQAVLDAQVKGADPAEIRKELVQVVAVALSMLENCDRADWSKP